MKTLDKQQPLSTSSLQTRQYYIDWIRVLAFGILIFFHTGMFFVHWGWHVKNNELTEVLEIPMEWLHLWRLPLLFFISGVGVSFAMKSKTAGAFIAERSKRLLIPLLFGVLVIVPPQVYFERLQRHQFEGSYWDFYPKIFEFQAYPDGNSSWHHLWFIAYLWVFSVIATPLFVLLKNRSSEGFWQFFQKLANKPLGLLLWAVVLASAYWFLHADWPVFQNLVADWYNFTTSMMLFVLGYLIGKTPIAWDIMEKYRRSYAVLGLFIVAFRFSYDTLLGSIPEDTVWMTIVNGLLTMVSLWCTILAIGGYAKHYLNFTNQALQYSNQAVYPFYILHQTITVALGFYLAEVSLNLWIKYILIAAGTFGISWLIYHYLIRPFGLTSFLFGVKK